MMLHRTNHTPRLYIVLLLGLLITILAALPVTAQGPTGSAFPPSEGTVWGEAQALGDGEIQTFITQDEDGNPSLVGLYFAEAFLSNLPEEMSDGHWDILSADGSVLFPCCGHELVLEFPATDPLTAFEHALVNWGPAGHPPAAIYDVPHFDMHFYTIPVEDREAIAAATYDTLCMVPNPPGMPEGEHPVPVTCDTLAELTMPLPADQVPPGYMSVGEVVPGMGDHLINFASPELTGAAPFSHTWIYGANAGRLTFYEPMISLEFLQEKIEETCTDITMPEAMPEPGYYPTQYCIRYMPGDAEGNGAYAVTLEQFVAFE